MTKSHWHYICVEGLEDSFTPYLFDKAWLESQRKTNRILRQGRGAITYFQHAGFSLVLKQYRRGGFPARVSESSYLWSGLKNTRAHREFELLKHMLQLALPVPQPFACAIKKNVLSYQAFLITQRIEHSSTLWATLLEDRLRPGVWEEIGKCVKRFHAAGIYHADLNAANILLRQGSTQACDSVSPVVDFASGQNAPSVFVIDFDRGSLRRPGEGAWQQSNLSRLRRSLDKLMVRHSPGTFDESDWQKLLMAYAAPVDVLNYPECK